MKLLSSFIVLLLCVGTVFSLERKSYLKCGEVLVANEFIESTNGYYAVLQSDCNFVIYRSKHFVPRNALWASNTRNDNCNNPVLVNQNDGNVVLYNNGVRTSQNALFSTGTNNGSSCYNFVMQDDGNLVLYTLDGHAVWASNTNA